MKKAILILVVMLLGFTYNANCQKAKRIDSTQKLDVYEFYMYLSGVETKQDVLAIEEKVNKINQVSFFLGDQFPVRYFHLKAKNYISKATFESWIDPKYKVEYYAFGKNASEGALVLFNKNNKKQ